MRPLRVLMLLQRDWALRIGHHLALQLQAEGCTLAAITLKPLVDRWARTQREVTYQQIVSHDEFWNDPWTVPGVDDLSLTEVCRELGIDSIWPIAATEREYVRSYRTRYHYANLQNRTDREIAAYIKATYLRFARLLDEFRPDVIVGYNFVAVYQLVLERLALRRGVAMLGESASRVSGIDVVVRDHTFGSGLFVERIDALQSGRQISPNQERAREYIREFRKRFIRPLGEFDPAAPELLKERVKSQLRPFKLALRALINPSHDALPNIGPTPDNRSPRIILRDHFTSVRNMRDQNRFPYVDPSAVGPYAYMPLQAQPEAVIDTLAPFFSNQLETARLAAQSLPDDLTLVVKEHPAQRGRRSRAFYERLARTPNVNLVDWRLPADGLIRRAKVVISPGGTSVFEAALYGIPTIQLGSMGMTLRLPNVHHHTDWPTLAPLLRSVLAETPDNDAHDRLLEAYVSAAYDVGYPFRFTSAKFGGDKEALDAMWRAYKREIEVVTDGGGTTA